MLLDEPFGALDALTRAEMQRWLESVWAQSRSTVAARHARRARGGLPGRPDLCALAEARHGRRRVRRAPPRPRAAQPIALIAQLETELLAQLVAPGPLSAPLRRAERVRYAGDMTALRGVFAAAVTPFLDGGTRSTRPGSRRMADFLAEGGVDGALVCGTAGEGMVLSVAERKRALETYIAAAGSRIAMMAHCGAQTTADTVALAAHAAEAGAVGVSVIAPPYFPLDDRALLEHLAAAAQACAPLPFYIYASPPQRLSDPARR